jgi:anti-anti-sigma factor
MIKEEEGTIDVVRLPERLTHSLNSELYNHVNDSISNGRTRIAMDFKNTTYVGTSCIGVLISLSHLLKEKGGSLSLRNLVGTVKELFENTYMDEIFSIENSHGVTKPKFDVYDPAHDSQTEIIHENLGHVYILRLKGVVSFPNGARLLEKEFLLAIEKHSKFLISFEQVSFIDSTSVSILVGMFKLISDTGGSMRIYGSNNMIEDIFTALKVDTIIPLYCSKDDALHGW